MSEPLLPTKPAPDQPAVRLTRPGPTKNGGPAAPRTRGKTREKDPAGTAPGPVEAGAASAGRPPQQPQPQSEAAARGGGYLRLRIQVDEGALSIVGSRLVDSELVMPASLPGPFAYEVTRGETLLHTETVPDIGEFRSFGVPDGAGELRGHHRYPMTSYEFAARVPAAAVTADALPEIAVVLHRVKEPAMSPPRSEATLGRQFAREMREIGRVKGIPADVLPEQLRPR